MNKSRHGGVEPPSSCCRPAWDKASSRKKGGLYVGNDADLAREMNELSVEEREKVFNDIHGVPDVREETPEFLKACLAELDTRLARSRHKALSRALFLKPSLKTDDKFRLMFLRATDYDAMKATKRMCNYFDKKCELFGDDKIVKPITIADLTDEDLECQKTGLMMQLPFKDQTGRPVLFFDFSKVNWHRLSVKSLVRWAVYIVMNALDDDVAQTRGICAIQYAPGTSIIMPGLSSAVVELVVQGESIANSLPFRWTSIHICYDDPRVEFLVQATRVANTKDTRLRLRAHYGSPIEIEYNLMSFGLRTQGLLQRSKEGDESSNDFYMQYILKRMQLEQENAELEAQEEVKTGIVVYPKERDVLMGRGQPYRDHQPNQFFYQTIDANIHRYAKCVDKFEKTCVSMDMVKSIRAANYRILQPGGGLGWKIVDDVSVREKVAVAFRSRVRMTKSAAEAESNNSKMQQSSVSSGGNTASSTFCTMPPCNNINAANKRLRYDPSSQQPPSPQLPISTIVQGVQ